MSFVRQRNPKLAPRFGNIAQHYRRHGEAWGVRWDYAFFQMAVETNFLSFKRSNGRRGDVRPKQNNFAGLGTTGGGVPGDSYPNVSTGVLAQIQHLVVYSGQRVRNPVGARTRLKQEHILRSTAHLKGRVTFADLSRRWAADKRYGTSIEWVASRYRNTYCKGRMAQATVRPKAQAALPRATSLGGPPGDARASLASPVRTIWSRSEPHGAITAPAPAPATPVAAPTIPKKAPHNREARPQKGHAAAEPVVVPAPVDVYVRAPRATAHSAPTGPRAFAFAAAMAATRAGTQQAPDVAAANAAPCRVLAASYGGKKTLLVRARTSDEIRYTALTVLDGFESSMLANYVKAHAPGGSSVGEFKSRDDALARARELCPNVPPATQETDAPTGPSRQTMQMRAPSGNRS